ncbi:ABC transporter ATP-binding protein [Acinetobacter guillouiae]|uniref:ABC transporter ATP-binding protein n=1 Tax=Acinetobacter guillouiae TaxID=106649 RepID=UPI003AF78F03
MKKLIYAFLFFSTQLYAADTYLHGTIVDITSVSEGLLIKMDKQSVPDICQNRSPFGWMLIPNDRKAIMAVMLMNWYQKKTSASIYVDFDQKNNAYCTISQIDPDN